MINLWYSLWGKTFVYARSSCVHGIRFIGPSPQPLPCLLLTITQWGLKDSPKISSYQPKSLKPTTRLVPRSLVTVSKGLNTQRGGAKRKLPPSPRTSQRSQAICLSVSAQNTRMLPQTLRVQPAMQSNSDIPRITSDAFRHSPIMASSSWRTRIKMQHFQQVIKNQRFRGLSG